MTNKFKKVIMIIMSTFLVFLNIVTIADVRAQEETVEARGVIETYTVRGSVGIGPDLGSVDAVATIEYRSVGNRFILKDIEVIPYFSPLRPLMKLKSYTTTPSVGSYITGSQVKVDVVVDAGVGGVTWKKTIYIDI